MNKKRSRQGAGMVDVSSKKVTKRTAVASASIRMGPRAFRAFRRGESPKGDILETARVAGVMAAKATPRIIPFCHPLELNKVNIRFQIATKDSMITIIAETVYRGRTGVEMEALSAVTAAALTVYDMMKWADKGMVISDIKLLAKRGGKSGDYQRR